LQDRYAYYPGCLASLSQKELDSSSRAICQRLEVELIDMPSVTCCGAGDIHEAKPDYYLHLSARILGQAERTGASVLLTICNVCTLNLRQANARLQEDPAELARINDNLREVGAATYEGGVEVRHLLWEVSSGEGYERFKQVAVRSLEGLKVAPFYGCQILRPAKMLGFEDPDRPQSLERLITACGAEPVDYPAKVKCCGFPIILAREDVALGELIQPLQEATEAGADVMVTPCPLCHLSLDAWQKKASAQAGESFDLPVLHLAQLLGAAAGIAESELKFKRHVVRLGDDVKAKLRLPSAVGTAGD
jgi:succinate dehydrogenase / fumarate reductase cytochrome b subunit